METRTQVDMNLKVAPPEKASAILKAQGYPIDAKLLRRWYKAGKIPGCFTGKRVLLNIQRVIDYLETGDQPEEETGPDGNVRHIPV